MTQPHHLLPAALRYAARGWPVFMLGTRKRPVANCPTCRTSGHAPTGCGCLTCHGFYAATTNPHRIAAIVAAVPGGQLAIRTGAVSGLLVVDIDPGNGGWDSFARLRTAGMTSPTANVVTGSGGRHLYHRHPGGHIRSRALPGYPGIDIKADGGYVLSPPAIHPRTGRVYRWAPDGRPVGEMPPPLVTACQKPPQRDQVVAPAADTGPAHHTSGGGISSPDRLLAAHLDAVRRAPEGKRRTTLYGAARGAARMVTAGVLPLPDAIAALTTAGRHAQQTDRDIHAAITGGFHAEGVTT